jgi:hypothetical protein
MRQIVTFLITFLSIISYSNGQCLINEMSVNPTECNVNGDFYVRINFNHTGTPSPQFKVQGNGKNYGTFYYDSLPILIGPLKADCVTNYEFVVRDFENSNCTAFKELGKKCCTSGCKIAVKDIKVGACDGSFYSLGFDIDHNTGGLGFDVYNNGQFFGYYKYSSLPLSIPNLKSSNNEAFNQIVVCANDNSNCCDTLQIANPCICSIYKVKGQVIDCNEQDSTFSLKLNFKHHITADSFQIGGNTNNYGVFAYKDLPITIRGLKFSNTIDYEFLIVDRDDAFCFSSFPLGFVNNCDYPCSISNVKTTISTCDMDGNFYTQLSFSEKNTSIAGFTVRGNGQLYGNFEYGDDTYKIGPLKGDCQTIYEFIIKDKEIEGCTTATSLKDSVCCEAECAISNLKIKEICDDNKLIAFEINFDQKNNISDQFSLRINDIFIGSFKYADLPLKITNVNFDKSKVTFKIWDKENEACRMLAEHTFECSLINPCKIYDLVVTTTDCDAKGEFYAKVKFKHLNSNSQYFGIKVNGVLYDTFTYGQDIYELGPLKGDCSTLYKFLVYDFQYPDCGDDYAFTEKICCDKGDCIITDFQVKVSECNEDGEFYAVFKFKTTNPGNQGFVVKVNGVFYDSLAYGKDIYEIGPLNGDCKTLYKFLIYDRQFESCKADYAFTEKVCCDKEDCLIKNPLLTFTECEDKTYHLILDFSHNGTTPKFRVKVNGIVKGTYNFTDLPITITGLEEKIAHEIVVWDIENEACKMVFTVPGILCSTSTMEYLSSKIVLSINDDILKIDSRELGVQKRMMIYDIQGRLCIQKESGLTENEVDITSLPKGMYIISIDVGENTINKKFVKP